MDLHCHCQLLDPQNWLQQKKFLNEFGDGRWEHNGYCKHACLGKDFSAIITRRRGKTKWKSASKITWAQRFLFACFVCLFFSSYFSCGRMHRKDLSEDRRPCVRCAKCYARRLSNQLGLRLRPLVGLSLSLKRSSLQQNANITRNGRIGRIIILST